MNRTTHSLFIEMFDAITVELPYNHDTMPNETNYFNGLVDLDLGLEVGERFKIKTAPGNDRKIIGVVTPVGNLVFFERFTNGESGVVIIQPSDNLRGIASTGSSTVEQLDSLMGGVGNYNNIGKTLKRIITIYNKRESAAEELPNGPDTFRASE
jgi:hypothetical protein